jgi:hypothetical protein
MCTHVRWAVSCTYFPLICVLGKDEEASSSVLNWNPYTSSIAPCYATPASEGNQGESGWIYLSGLRVDLSEPVQWGLDDKHTRISLSQLRRSWGLTTKRFFHPLCNYNDPLHRYRKWRKRNNTIRTHSTVVWVTLRHDVVNLILFGLWMETSERDKKVRKDMKPIIIGPRFFLVLG